MSHTTLCDGCGTLSDANPDGLGLWAGPDVRVENLKRIRPDPGPFLGQSPNTAVRRVGQCSPYNSLGAASYRISASKTDVLDHALLNIYKKRFIHSETLN